MPDSTAPPTSREQAIAHLSKAMLLLDECDLEITAINLTNYNPSPRPDFFSVNTSECVSFKITKVSCRCQNCGDIVSFGVDQKTGHVDQQALCFACCHFTRFSPR